MHYLQTEVIPKGSGKLGGRKGRKMGHRYDRVQKFLVKVRNRVEEKDFPLQKFEFAPFSDFNDLFQTTDKASWTYLSKYGDLVGVQSFPPGNDTQGNPVSDPRFPWPVSYHRFSLSGVCPNVGMSGGDDQCLKYESGKFAGDELKGGVSCQATDKVTEPDGEQGCIYTIELTSTVTLDALSGIRNQQCGRHNRTTAACQDYEDFLVNCTNSSLQYKWEDGKTYCSELIPACPDGCPRINGSKCSPSDQDRGLPFWLNRCNSAATVFRVKELERLTGTATGYENEDCGSYSGCERPDVEKGTGYCSRLFGVCEPCYIPGTVSKAAANVSQTPCRPDMFKVQGSYADKIPKCRTSHVKDACCVYAGTCKDRGWQASDWSVCSSACGQGEHTRTVVCPYEATLGSCSKRSPKPATVEACTSNTTCKWETSDWGLCSETCGSGEMSRNVMCPPDAPPQACPESAKPAESTVCVDHSECGGGVAFYIGIAFCVLVVVVAVVYFVRKTRMTRDMGDNQVRRADLRSSQRRMQGAQRRNVMSGGHFAGGATEMQYRPPRVTEQLGVDSSRLMASAAEAPEA